MRPDNSRSSRFTRWPHRFRAAVDCGKAFDTPKADFWRLRDGKIVEFYEYFDTAQVMAAAT